jgi:hypothetical protein
MSASSAANAHIFNKEVEASIEKLTNGTPISATSKLLKYILLRTLGEVTWYNHHDGINEYYVIKHKHLGAGAYKVWTEKKF